MSEPFFPFRRVVIAGTSPEFDADLVHYGATLASLGEETEMVVLSRTSRELQSFALAPQPVLAARMTAIPERVSCQVVVEPDVDGLLASVANLHADLMVLRPPHRDRRRRQIVHRLAVESPCSVCFVPHGSPPRQSRVVAGIEPDETGAAVLRAASSICRRAGSDELAVVRTWLCWTLDPAEAALDRQREREWLDLFRFLDCVDLNGIDCTPRVEESARFSTGVLRVTEEREADLIVVAAPESSRTCFPDGRPPQEDLVLRSPVPLLLLRVAKPERRPVDVLRGWFAGSEPTFG